MIHIDIPEDVEFIISSIRAEGYEAYAVGGCVRDCLLGVEPKDWDITTSALPEEVKKIFLRTIDTGIKHGTVTVMLHGTGYEITTYRVDGEYLDGRHPENVSFTGCLDEDLKRRDFTINAFVYSEETGIKDLFGGLDDLKCGIIRCVGEPEERFKEDALRILRAVRFSAKLGFIIEPATYKAAVLLRKNLSLVSSERIKTEIDKILVSDNPGHLCLLKEMQLSDIIMPELNAAEDRFIKESLENCKKELSLRWAVLGYILEKNTGAGSAEKVMHRLKFDNKTQHKVNLFIQLSREELPVKSTDSPETEDKTTLHSRYRIMCRKLINHTGKEDIFDYLSYCEALSAVYQEFSNDYSGLRNEIQDIFEKNECTCLKELKVNGRDILLATEAKGMEIGKILDGLLELVINSPELNNREWLLKNAGKL